MPKVTPKEQFLLYTHLYYFGIIFINNKLKPLFIELHDSVLTLKCLMNTETCFMLCACVVCFMPLTFIPFNDNDLCAFYLCVITQHFII